MCVDKNTRTGGLGFPPIGGAEENQHGTTQCPGNVGGTRIGTEDTLGAIENGDERADVELAAEVDQAPRGIERKPRTNAHDDEFGLGHRIDQLLIIAPWPELGAPLGIGVQDDVGTEILQGLGQGRARGELEIEGLDGDVEVLEAGEVTLGGGNGAIGDELGVHGLGAFAGGHEADPARAVGGPRHKAAAEQALEIDGDVVVLRAQLFAPAPDLRDALGVGPPFARVGNDLPQAGMALKDFAEGVVDDPVDLRIRPAALESGQDRQCLDDIAQAAGFDDEDFQSVKCSGGILYSVILSLSKDQFCFCCGQGLILGTSMKSETLRVMRVKSQCKAVASIMLSKAESVRPFRWAVLVRSAQR
jgi:hypothetical protein